MATRTQTSPREIGREHANSDPAGVVFRVPGNDTRITLDAPSPRLTPEEARRSKVDDHDRRILAALAEEPMSANGLLNSGRVRVNRRDLYTATTRLVESGRLARGPKGTLQLTGEVFQVFQNDRTPCVVRGRAKRRCSTCSRACEARTGNTFRAARKIDCRHRGDPVTRTATCLR